MKALKKAIEIAGSQTELAKQMGVTPQFIHQVYRKNTPLPPIHCKKIKNITDGRVMEWELRPDIFDPPEMANAV